MDGKGRVDVKVSVPIRLSVIKKTHEPVSFSHAADLNEKEWSIIVRTNCLLSGYKVVKHDKVVGGSTPMPPDPSGSDKKTSKSKIRGRTVTDFKIERTPYSGM